MFNPAQLFFFNFFFFLCSWLICLGAVFTAWGQRKKKGEGEWLHLLGDLLQGPHCGLAWFSCLSSKAQPSRGRERGSMRQTIHWQWHCCSCRPLCPRPVQHVLQSTSTVIWIPPPPPPCLVCMIFTLIVVIFWSKSNNCYPRSRTVVGAPALKHEYHWFNPQSFVVASACFPCVYFGFSRYSSFLPKTIKKPPVNYL